MTVDQIMVRMIAHSDRNVHDIEHLLKVWAYARTIGQSEGLPADTQYTLEAAAIVHDIACPLCRQKYGRTDGPLQELESPALVQAFFEGTAVPAEVVNRVSFLVGHHHTVTGVDGIDWQILLEADFLVNAAESGYPSDAIRRFYDKVANTQTGRRLLSALFGC